MSHSVSSRRSGSQIHNAQATTRVRKNYNCKKCKEPDETAPMVQCGTCGDWFHFPCVGVSAEIENVDWHCNKCIGMLTADPTTTKGKNKKKTRATNEKTMRKIDATTKVVERLEPVIDKSTIVNTVGRDSDIVSEAMRNVDAGDERIPPKHCTPVLNVGSVRGSSARSSTSTSKSKNVRLQLLKLEEERKLQERRDKEYIEKKYAILELESDVSDGDVSKSNSSDSGVRVHEWLKNSNLQGGARVTLDEKRTDLGVIRNLEKSQIAARQFMSKEPMHFTGRSEEWPLFISWWQNTSDACGFSKSENMLRLQRCLKGKALEAVQYRLLHPDQVDDVISTLKMLFGRPEVIIQSLIKKIRSEPDPKYERLETLIQFSLEVDNVCRMMQVTDLSAHLNNPCLLQELVDRLPTQIKLSWGMFKQTVSQVDLVVFNNWLGNYARAASEVTWTVPNSFDKNRNKKSKVCINVHQETKPKEENECITCKGACKSLATCEKFLKLPLSERWKVVKGFSVCRICLRRHGSRRCLSSQQCGVMGCSFRHNTLLHNNTIESKLGPGGYKSSTEQQTNNGAVQPSYYSGTTLRSNKGLTLFKVIPVRLHFKEKSIDTYAFLDDGSSVTLIDEKLAESLEADGVKEPLCLRWTANTHRREESSKKITFEISAIGSGQKYLLPNAHTVKSLGLPGQSLDFEELKKRYNHLKGLPLSSYFNAKPQILIGLQHWRLGMPLKSREGKDSQPAAIKTRLGWTLFGVTPEDSPQENHNADINIHLCDCQVQIDSQLHETVKQFFALENAGTKITKREMSDQDRKAVQLLDEKAVCLGNSYAVPLLWKHEQIRLPETKAMAEKRLHCLEKRLLSQPQLMTKVNSQIEEYVKKGYAKKLTESEVQNPMPRVWYLPIFPVLNVNKPDKLRIVWDAAAKVGGVSLNSCLMTGPDNVPLLPSVLFRFRERKVAISADIREMFHQIKILEEDRDAQRFLWRNSESGNIEVYQMQVMTFGATCSPFCAQYIKNKNAKRFENQYPRAVKAIIANHYVDDLLDSVDTEEEAITLAREIIYIHKQIGFEIRNFVSNSPRVLNALQAKVTKPLKTFNENGQSEFEKLLGMWWSPSTDAFVYTFKTGRTQHDIMNGKQVPTKREVLRALMCVFDPLGLIANFTIQLKIILQEIWRSAIGWDEQIKERQFQKWKTWLSLIPDIKRISIDRRYLTNLRFGSGSNVELHVFVDAGEEAMAAVAYMRVTTNDEVECALISSKTKVAPIKALSIPRLELEAAVLGTRLSKFITSSHTIQFNSTTFWADSRVVLSWIKSTNKKFKSFVAVRIGEILESTNADQWNWVSSKENVADDASKYKNNYDFRSTSRWYKAPKFLHQNPISFSSENPEIQSDDEGAEEIKECYVHCSNQTKSVLDYNRFSRWKSLLKTMTYVFRFVKIFLLKWKTPKVLNDSEETVAARIYLYKQCQQEGFHDEYDALTRAKISGSEVSLSKSSTLYKLSPYLDENGVVRVAGRIDAINNVPFDTKRPIILPKDHKITQLIVYEYHAKIHHLFNETVVNELRKHYYIPNLRRTLRKVQRQCQYCKNKKAVPLPPRMAGLPSARLQPFQRPFSYTGVDYFGPLHVKVGRRSEKRWGMLLTCLTLRAIHIEIVHSLSSDSCILGIKRFICRRGMPKEIYSDNGTNFRGASNELKQALTELNRDAVAKEFELELKWSFIPPVTPHMGGCWERMVRSVKQVLAEISPISNPCDELLLSMMAEIESIVNSRPLTYVPLDCENSEALTPNHLLIGYANQERLSKHPIDDGAALRKNWLAAGKYAQAFWQRWIREYLPDLTRRTKWYEPQRQLQEGDIVIVVDPNSARKTWPKGRVLEVITGKDGVVRSAVVQTLGGIYKRPVVKLAVLDVHKFGEGGNPGLLPGYRGDC